MNVSKKLQWSKRVLQTENCGYTLNNKCQKCADMDLNGFILEKIKILN